MCPPKAPKSSPQAPAAAPAPPAPAASVAQADPMTPSGETQDSIENRVRRRGRSSLRIDPMSSDNTGLNIPVS